jgi:anthranilate phosphoribosyltransferase
MSDITRLIKQLSSDLSSQSSLAPVVGPGHMRGVFAEVLDGGASDLELGGLIAMCAAVAAQRHRSIYVEILLGLLDAVRERVVKLSVHAGDFRTVVLPNYGDRDSGNAVPLIALKLQRLGIPVIVHGALETSGGLANCGIFRELGVLPVATRGQAEMRLAESGLALVPTSLISPGLAAMMSLKSRLGISTPAHILASLLMPIADAAEGTGANVVANTLQVVNVPRWLEALLDDGSALTASPTLVALTEQSCFGHLDNRPRLVYKADGRSSEAGEWRLLFDEEATSRSEIVRSDTVRAEASRPMAVPADTRGFAAWTRQRLDGKLALPVPVVNQLACCIYGAGYVQDFNQAKAVAAVETGSLAA